jgi:hypothetical protein
MMAIRWLTLLAMAATLGALAIDILVMPGDGGPPSARSCSCSGRSAS